MTRSRPKRPYTSAPTVLATIVSLLVATVLTIAVALSYGAAPRTGLEVVRSRTTLPASAADADTPLAACAALPHRIRAQAPPLAFISGGALRFLNLTDCRERTLIPARVTGPVRVSADGRYVAAGAAIVASREDDSIQRPLGTGIWVVPNRSTWAWAPRGDEMAGITQRGAVIAGRPGHSPRELEPPGWGATSITFDGPDWVLAVRGQGELWALPLGRGHRRVHYRGRGATAVLQLAVALNGWAVLWSQPFPSASTAADGDTLLRVDLSTGRAVRIAAPVLIGGQDVTRCGLGLAVMEGAGRDTTGGKTIVVFSPRWRPRRVGIGVAPTCSANGATIAYATAAGPAEPDLSFGSERRRIAVRRAGHRPLLLGAVPARGPGADDPILSTNGEVVEWVAANDQPLTPDAVTGGSLRAALTSGPEHLTGPLANLGVTGDYYGTLSWTETIAPAAR